MSKILSTFGFYWHFILDIILTHIFVIAFLTAGYPAIAASLMTVDSLLKISSSVIVSRIAAQFTHLTRGKMCTVLRFILILLWISSILHMPVKSISMDLILPFILFKIILLFDTALSSEFVFSLQELYKIDLTQSSAAQNIIIRSSTAIAPAIAMTVLFSSYAKIGAFVLAILIYTVSLPNLIKIFSHTGQNNHFSPPSHILTFRSIIANPIMRWGIVFQLFGNLSFAGIAFLLLSQLNPHGYLFLNQITALYAAFFVSQCCILLYGEKCIPATTTRDVAIIMALCSVFVIVSSLSQGLINLAFCAAIGIVYSVLLSAIQKIVTSRLMGNGFITYIGWSQMIGRLAAFASITLLGAAISAGIGSTLLLVICGIMGICFSILLSLLN